MKEINMVDELLRSQTFQSVSKGAKRYLKWIVLAGIVLLLLAISLMVMIVIGIFNLLIWPLISNGPALTEQGQSIMIEGQKWWEQRFFQEQTQLQEIQKQLDDVKQSLEQHNQQESTESAN